MLDAADLEALGKDIEKNPVISATQSKGRIVIAQLFDVPDEAVLQAFDFPADLLGDAHGYFPQIVPSFIAKANVHAVLAPP